MGGLLCDGKLKKIPVTGGPVVTLCDAPVGRGGSWTSDGRIIASLNSSGGLSSVSAGGGIPEPLTEIKDEPAGVTSHRWPQVLPAGAGVLFTAMPTVDAEGELRVLAPNGSAKTLVKRVSDARYLSSGHIRIAAGRGIRLRVQH